jgi:hypothetical protein
LPLNKPIDRLAWAAPTERRVQFSPANRPVRSSAGGEPPSAEITDAWVGAQQAHGLTERVEIAVDLLVDLEDCRFERVHLAQVQSQQKTVLAGDPPL